MGVGFSWIAIFRAAPEGERQAEAVAERLAGERWDAIYSSPLRRAYQTALAIARRTGQSQVITDQRLSERHMGEAEGMPDVDLRILWPGVPWDAIPGMEPIDTLAARAHIEYAGEKGRVSAVALAGLLMGRQPGGTALEPVIWNATAIEAAWVDDELVGFARAFTDGVLYGCIDIVVALPGYEQVRPVLIHRLERRFPDVKFSLIPGRPGCAGGNT